MVNWEIFAMSQFDKKLISRMKENPEWNRIRKIRKGSEQFIDLNLMKRNQFISH